MTHVVPMTTTKDGVVTNQESGIGGSMAGRRFDTLPIYEPVYRPEQLANHYANIKFKKVACIALPIIGIIALVVGLWITGKLS